ncbi:acyltransferase 3 [Plectosphaerella plurivora]|uniref:Acyltransferase 3 n=1 Tax=Plectosphaerella plurivora TaxID=936078 RepID=A0A9P8VIA0_9PEZI|nr:acyltransferase 3 [Plectosphaerella plurivora]
MMSLAMRSLRGAANRLSTRSYSYAPLSAGPSPESPTSTDSATKTAFSARIYALLFFLLPSFVQTRIRPGTAKPHRLRPTSWLDGLRGVASLIVFFCHYTEGTQKSYTLTYGVHFDGDEVSSSPLQLPFIRVLYAGRPMVHIFFIISGFVLSYKPLRQLRSRDYDGLQQTLSSSVFRRGFRLFLPTTVSTFLGMLTIYYGIQRGKAPLPSLWEQFVDWCGSVHHMITLSWVWDALKAPKYDVHLWTIPVEMSFSMFLFVVITGLSRVKTFLRMAILVGIMVYCITSGHWAGLEFLAGMGLAEIQLIQDARELRNADCPLNKEAEDVEEGTFSVPAPSSSQIRYIGRRLLQAVLSVNLVFGLYVAGWPNEKAEVSPGFISLYRNTMEPYLSRGDFWPSFPWFSIGAVQIVAALHQIEPLQRVFTTAPVQYLANISYAIYLCHGPVMKSIHHRWMPHIWVLVGGPSEAGMWGRMLVWLLGLVAMAVPVIWVSDLFWRMVDVKSVELARRIERFCLLDN